MIGKKSDLFSDQRITRQIMLSIVRFFRQIWNQSVGGSYLVEPWPFRATAVTAVAMCVGKCGVVSVVIQFHEI
jgi:hypothetical protein